MKKKFSWGAFLFRILMYVIAFLSLIPLLWVVRTAFIEKKLALDFFAPFIPTWEHFETVLSSAPFFQYYLNTFILVAGTLAVQLLFITPAAYAFARMEFYGKNILFTLFLTQLMITPDVLIFPTYQLMAQLRMTDTLVGVMLPFFASAMGIFLLRQNIKTIPYELEEAARVEGYSTLKIIRYIYVPLLRPAYAAFALISVSYHWNDFLWPLVMINDVSKRPVTLGLALFAQAYETGAQWSVICAATFLVIAPLLLLFILFQRQFIESFAQSGIK